MRNGRSRVKAADDRLRGTSVEQIDKPHGHLLPDSIDRTKAALDALVERMGTDRALETEAAE